jgi:hypothetical protein
MAEAGRTRAVRPGRGLLLTEPARSTMEFGATAALLPILRRAPRGDGHSVLVFPGLMASDYSTRLLRWYLRDLGYRAHGWKLGTNVGPTDEILDGIVGRVRAVHRASGRPISLIGWSLGGIYAREMARRFPDAVRQVITLGSPFAMTDRRQSNARGMYEAFSPTHSARIEGLRVPEDQRPPILVPATSIYSTADGIVPWQSCVDRPRSRAENIRVPGSHIGLGHNPRVLQIIADRLAQPAGAWKPYRDRSA